MKVGIVSPYFSTFGGGERYMLTAAKFFLGRGDRVDVFAAGPLSTETIQLRFGLDLSRVNIVTDKIFTQKGNWGRKLLLTAGYDLMFFLSDGSIPFTAAKRNWLHFQAPFTSDSKNLANRIKLARFEKVICNSHFTKRFIDRSYGVQSAVVYPPVDVENIRPGRKKNIILSVGRFSAPSHPKKQEVMLAAFKTMVERGLIGWRLVFFGGAGREGRGIVAELKKISRGHPVDFVTDGNYDELRTAYAQAKIYWHAAGVGEDLDSRPEKAEHFGITTVEAMAAGAVPVVFAGGGQKEIIREQENGLFWQGPEELVAKTGLLIKKRDWLSKLSGAATQRAQDFSQEKFFAALGQLLF